jgi:formylglycine-generating enzyme required for sulfatase activity
VLPGFEPCLRFDLALRRKIRELHGLNPNDDLVRLLEFTPAEPKPGEITALFLPGGVEMMFAHVPAGTFWMGGGGGKPGDKRVTIAAPFSLAIYPVTQGEWRAVMGNDPSYFSKTGGGWATVSVISDADLALFPVEQVSWDDVQEFLRKLNEKERGSGLLYGLPTEAEWEYACRGGALSRQDCSYHYYLQQPTNDLTSTHANCDGNYPFGNAKKGPYLERTSKVGSYPPNRLGIYDMHGNVWEWTADLQEGSSDRVFRGGCWFHDAELCQAALRGWFAPDLWHFNLGFRLARVPSAQ